ncbi:MAG TPA: VanW family protein, partial [Acidimicrobiales bacterium]|nr:VanW family protein [Acidimicrobiales bacterium]
ELVADAVREGRRERVGLPLKTVQPRRTVEEARALGIKEPVAAFTTNHAPNQPRVRNIHRIADMLRGRLIEPGQTLSVNDAVGRRTVDKGFVVDAVIEDGKFEEEVGGGISQFATTLFNAAFFAGLEFPEYQSHSIYISRYPYGREATLSYPRPDLKLRNPSPHGVLLWPTYTGSSITVTLYSTKWVEAAQTAQTTEPRGPCTRVRTTRTRKMLSDGSVKVDHVSALYRPGEGINCT